MSKADRPLIFLMAAVVSADVAPGARPSGHKLKKMDRVLARRFPDLSPAERWQAVRRALAGMPALTDGHKLLQLVERQTRKLSAALEGKPSRSRRVLQFLVAIADADNEITPQEARVVHMIAHGLGASAMLEEREDEWGERLLAVA